MNDESLGCIALVNNFETEFRSSLVYKRHSAHARSYSTLDADYLNYAIRAWFPARGDDEFVDRHSARLYLVGHGMNLQVFSAYSRKATSI